MKLTEAQVELMSFLNDGCRVRLCVDSRISGVKVFRPGQFSYLAAQMNGKEVQARLTYRSVLALLKLGLIVIVAHDGQTTTYAAK